MNLKYQIDTKFNQDYIELTEEWVSEDTNLFDQTTRNIINLRDQAVRDALNALGWISPEDALAKDNEIDWLKRGLEDIKKLVNKEIDSVFYIYKEEEC